MQYFTQKPVYRLKLLAVRKVKQLYNQIAFFAFQYLLSFVKPFAKIFSIHPGRTRVGVRKDTLNRISGLCLRTIRNSALAKQ